MRFEENKMKYGKIGKEELNNNENEIKIVTEVTAWKVFFLWVTQVLIKGTQIEAHVSPSISGTKDSWRYGLCKCTVGNFRMNLLPF